MGLAQLESNYMEPISENEGFILFLVFHLSLQLWPSRMMERTLAEAAALKQEFWWIIDNMWCDAGLETPWERKHIWISCRQNHGNEIFHQHIFTFSSLSKFDFKYKRRKFYIFTSQWNFSCFSAVSENYKSKLWSLAVKFYLVQAATKFSALHSRFRHKIHCKLSSKTRFQFNFRVNRRLRAITKVNWTTERLCKDERNVNRESNDRARSSCVKEKDALIIFQRIF